MASRLGAAEPFRVLRRADRRLFLEIAASHNPALDRALPALSHAADYGRLWLVIAAALAASGRPAWRRGALRGLASLALASGAVNGLAKMAIQRSRPSLERVPLARRVRRAPVTTSFPSGHSASAAAFAGGVGLEAPELAVPLAALAAAVAFSRVWTGAHYPGDVIAGVGIGVSGAALTAAAVRPARRTVARGRPPGRRRR